MKTCLIIGAAADCFWDRRVTPELTVCADGGLDSAKKLGLSADITIGDFDSAVSAAPKGSIILPAEKGLTDLEACVNHGLSLGFKDFYLIGCTGGRLDHFFASVYLLEYLRDCGAYGRLVDERNEIFLCGKLTELIPPHNYKYFSVIALDEELRGVKIENAKYDLNSDLIRRAGGSLTVSNETLPGKTARISIDKGVALIALSKD